MRALNITVWGFLWAFDAGLLVSFFFVWLHLSDTCCLELGALDARSRARVSLPTVVVTTGLVLSSSSEGMSVFITIWNSNSEVDSVFLVGDGCSTSSWGRRYFFLTTICHRGCLEHLPKGKQKNWEWQIKLASLVHLHSEEKLAMRTLQWMRPSTFDTNHIHL